MTRRNFSFSENGIMGMMKEILGRYFVPFVTLLAVLFIIIVLALLQFFDHTNELSGLILEAITGWPVVGKVFSFVLAEAVYLIITVCLLLGVVFGLGSRRYFRSRALKRIHDWAGRAVVALGQFREMAAEKDHNAGKFDELHQIVLDLTSPARGLRIDTTFVGGRLGLRVLKALRALHAMIKRIQQEDRTVFRDLPTLQRELAEIMITAFTEASSEKSDSN